MLVCRQVLTAQYEPLGPPATLPTAPVLLTQPKFPGCSTCACSSPLALGSCEEMQRNPVFRVLTLLDVVD